MRNRPIFLLVLSSLLLAACSDNDSPSEEVAAIQSESSQNDISLKKTDGSEAIPLTQLPSDVSPVHYRVMLEIDPGLETFNGRTEIDIRFTKPRASMWLHGQDLDVKDAKILYEGEEHALIVEQVDDSGILRIDFSNPVSEGQATLVFSYSASFDQGDDGMYINSDEAGNSYAFTQFESTSARKVFPSFDEPGFKVPFDIELIVPDQDVAISNSPEESVEPLDDDKKRITFSTSRPMPTYLVAFAVGPFDVVVGQPIQSSEHRENTIPFRALATKGKGEELAFAIANTEDIVLALEDYFDYPYPYAKLDIIAVPAKGGSAMENVGAITYGEQIILFNEGSTVEQERGFLNTHAHELAHQWFGNLVTPKWWDDIWLNEAFATWMAHTILERMYPGENYREDMAANTSFVMSQDSLVSTRQIRQAIENHGDINSAFDGITYLKGGGVLTMFEAFMGEDQFRKGIRHYMKKHAWGNTDALDFMTAISEVNEDVDSAVLLDSFNTFIEQPGVPIVDFKLSCGESNQLTLSQGRYFPIGSTGASEQTWNIPVCVKYSQSGALTESCAMITRPQQSILLEGSECPEFVIPNAGGNSYFRWNLSSTQWQNLLGNFDKLSPNEQLSAATSLSAAFNIAEIDLDTFLESVAVLSESSSRQVATAPINDLLPVVQYLVQGDKLKPLQQRLVKFYKPRLDALHEKSNKTAEEQQLYNFLLSIVARYFDDKEWRGKLEKEAIAYTGFGGDGVLRPEKIDTNIRSNALRVAADDIGLPFVKHLWVLVNQSDDAALRELMIRAMAFSGNPEASAFVRELILDENLRPEEISFVLFHQGYYQHNRDEMWNWTRAHYDEVIAKVGEESKRQVIGLFYSFCRNEKADEVEAFFKDRVDEKEDASRTLTNTLETIRLCASFVEAHS